MKKLIHLFWLIPIWLFFLSFYELFVWKELTYTAEHGEDILAEVTYFKLKNMQSQSNGVLEIRMTSATHGIVDHKMSLPVQLAAQIRPYGQLPVRFIPERAQPVAIMPTIRFHLRMILINIAITMSSALVMSGICFYASRYAIRSEHEVQPIYVAESA